MTALLCIVPARGGSKRLPGKNLRTLGDRPLLDHTARALDDAGLGEAPCLLSTDDEAIAARGRVLGWRVPWLRPAALATDQAATVDTVFHALDWYASESGGDPERVMVLQPTSPLRGAACLTAALAALDSHADADAVVGMRRLHVPNDVAYRIDDAGFAQPVAHLGELAPNGAVYLVRTAALRTHRSLYPPRTLPWVMDPIASIDIDTGADWRLAEAALAAMSSRESKGDAMRHDRS
ncbi:MAG: acylneuraminate cytidylyltransferase family protein [Alphaproteobacteria bacterium]|jgi:CMP-N-acetylneuraminic acid synthetase|nr:acylneuraminate cytidylyltransferase family protein [Alphaproteobacteria bacterium]